MLQRGSRKGLGVAAEAATHHRAAPRPCAQSLGREEGCGPPEHAAPPAGCRPPPPPLCKRRWAPTRRAGPMPLPLRPLGRRAPVLSRALCNRTRARDGPHCSPGPASVGIPSSWRTPGPRICTPSAGWIATWRGRGRPGLRAEPGSASPSLRVRRLWRRCAPALARPPPRGWPPARAPEPPRRLRPLAASDGAGAVGKRSAPLGSGARSCGCLCLKFNCSLLGARPLPPPHPPTTTTPRPTPPLALPPAAVRCAQPLDACCLPGPGAQPGSRGRSAAAQAGGAERRARQAGFVCGRVGGLSARRRGAGACWTGCTCPSPGSAGCFQPGPGGAYCSPSCAVSSPTSHPPPPPRPSAVSQPTYLLSAPGFTAKTRGVGTSQQCWVHPGLPRASVGRGCKSSNPARSADAVEERFEICQSHGVQEIVAIFGVQ